MYLSHTHSKPEKGMEEIRDKINLTIQRKKNKKKIKSIIVF
jgi:hypothetical protein